MSIFLPINISDSSLFDTKIIDQKWNSFLNDVVNVINSTYSSTIDINDFNSIINKSLQSIYGLQNSTLEKFTPTKIDNNSKTSSKTSNKTSNKSSICKGLTSKKTPCKLNTLSNSEFCKRHSVQNETDIKKINKNDEKNDEEEKEIKPSSLKNKIIDIVKPKKEKASTKLIKATESISLPKKEPFNFKTHKPVNIFDTKFWKIGPFLYDDDKDLIINSTTGLIFETISATEVKLFGRSVEGELVLAKDCPEDIIEWSKKCGILIDEEDNESEDEENDNESNSENDEDSEDEKEE
jgi:hypothetical protein